MRRRDLLQGTILLPLSAALSGSGGLALAFASPARADTKPGPAAFQGDTVRKLAHDLAAKPFHAPDTKLPAPLSDLNYDQYRGIRFDPQHALWRNDGLPFQLQFFHRGFLYTNRVDLYVVADGKAQEIAYNPDLFSFSNSPRPAPADIGYAGFRIHAPINRPDYFDEITAFLGASYFRAVGKGQGYGLSARGLAIKTADSGGEEFPFFKAFWIERPSAGTNSIVVHALLDSASASAAYRFTIRPGGETVFDVEMSLYPRVDIDQPGIAPLTSMYYFDANDRQGVDDYRSAVHDSDGLLMWTGHGEQLWRPLTNPHDLQISTFSDVTPRGFGLIQRKRAFTDYDDLESRYERRPSLWVEPIGDWGEGAVNLVEIPTNQEIHDNIVAYWRPKQKLSAKGEYAWTYRLHWCGKPPLPEDLARIVDTRAGAYGKDGMRIFVLEATGEKLKGLAPEAAPRADVTADHGKILNPVVQPNPQTGGWRLSFQLAPENAKVAELRARLVADDGPLTEAWVYRWTP